MFGGVDHSFFDMVSDLNHLTSIIRRMDPKSLAAATKKFDQFTDVLRDHSLPVTESASGIHATMQTERGFHAYFNASLPELPLQKEAIYQVRYGMKLEEETREAMFFLTGLFERIDAEGDKEFSCSTELQYERGTGFRMYENLSASKYAKPILVDINKAGFDITPWLPDAGKKMSAHSADEFMRDCIKPYLKK
jgi:hypothetical protein